jgi:hypothetical protein
VDVAGQAHHAREGGALMNKTARCFSRYDEFEIAREAVSDE